MALDDGNLKVDFLHKNIFEFHYRSSGKFPDLTFKAISDDGNVYVSEYNIGYKKFSIEGFTHGENAGMIQLKIEK